MAVALTTGTFQSNLTGDFFPIEKAEEEPIVQPQPDLWNSGQRSEFDSLRRPRPRPAPRRRRQTSAAVTSLP